MVLRRLISALYKKGVPQSQAGCMKYRDTIEHIACLSHAIKEGFHKYLSTQAVFINFKFAFDRIFFNIMVNDIIDILMEKSPGTEALQYANNLIFCGNGYKICPLEK